MCIICNCDDAGQQFLTEYEEARQSMAAATSAMLQCSLVPNPPEVQRRYDATHKKMVRLVREWNSLEQERETHKESKADPAWEALMGDVWEMLEKFTVGRPGRETRPDPNKRG